MKRETHFVQAIALFVLLGLIPASFFLPNGAALIWTIAIPVVPLLIVVVGYNRWRKLCPLAWIAAVGQFFHWIPKRKVPLWFEKNYYYFQFSLLFLAFSARLLLINFSGTFLALFLLLVAFSAFLINLFFAGKSWCNFFCPVAIVEKIYCGSNALLSQQTSACSSCVACKSNCPDIDLEKSYWKENSERAKEITFYAFAGLVFGFYAYYYAISGGWGYYFDGQWAYEEHAYTNIFGAGFFFMPFIPKILAAPITLIFFSALSYYFFKQVEKIIPKLKWARNKDDKTIKHIVKSIAAFSAFNIFYVFAGAPTFVYYPALYALFHFAVIVVSSIILWKEIFREERFYLQERFAQKILKKWKGPWPAPTNLKEIYYTYSNQQESQQEKLELYKETVLEMLSDGTLSKEDFTLLDKIREQLGLSELEHQKVLRSLKRDNEELFDEKNALSSEKIYQLKLYKKHLFELLEQEVNSEEISKTQQRFHISDDEHKRIYDELVRSDNNLEERIVQKLKQLQQSAKLIAALTFHHEQKSANYLLFTLSNSFQKKFEQLTNNLSLLSPQDRVLLLNLNRQVRNYFEHSRSEQIEIKYANFLTETYTQEMRTILDSLQEVVMYDKERLYLIIREHLSYQEEELTAAILYYFYDHELYNLIDYRSYTGSECILIAEITRFMREKNRSISQIEVMAYLHKVPLFSKLGSEELYQLSMETKRVNFKNTSNIVKQGDSGDLFYIITKGTAHVLLEKNNKFTTLATLTEGDYIGEVSIISRSKRTATVIAKGYVETLELSAKAFDKLLSSNPSLALLIMKDVTTRLIEQNQV